MLIMCQSQCYIWEENVNHVSMSQCYIWEENVNNVSVSMLYMGGEC